MKKLFVDKNEVNTIAKQYLDGLSLKDIALQYNCVPSTIMLALKRNGIEIRPRGQHLLGKESNSKGHRWSDEHKQRMSMLFSREKHWNWRGGSSKIAYPVLWNKQLKDRVRVRDDFKCQLCGTPELELSRKLDINHIDYNKSNVDLDNLIALCHPCHTKTNSHQDYWKSHLKRESKIA